MRNSETYRGACGESDFIQSETGEQFLRYPLSLKPISKNVVIELPTDKM
jgi:hypothetical protein